MSTRRKQSNMAYRIELEKKDSNEKSIDHGDGTDGVIESGKKASAANHQA